MAGGLSPGSIYNMIAGIGTSYQGGLDRFAEEQERARKLAELKAEEEGQKRIAQGLLGLHTAPTTSPEPGAITSQTPLASKLPTFAAAQGGAPNRRIVDMISQAAQKYGEDPQTLIRTAQIESRLDPNAKNRNSSASGLFQFITGTAKQYGLTNPFDPEASADAGARLARDNRNVLRNALGRDPTPGEIYLAHQQGGGGAAKLLANPNARAVDIIGADAVRLNGGNMNMTAGQFAGKWTGKFGTPSAADMLVAGGIEAQGFAVPQGNSGLTTPLVVDAPAPSSPAARSPQTAPPVAQLPANVRAALGGASKAERAWGIEQAQKLAAQGQTKWETFKTDDGRQIAWNPLTRQTAVLDPGGGAYRPMTPQEKVTFGVPENTAAAMGPGGKPVVLPGTAKTEIKGPEAEAQKKITGAYADDLIALRASSQDAATAKNAIRLMKTLASDSNFYSGFAGEKVKAINRALGAFGVKDPAAASPSEAFTTMANELTLTKLGGKLGAGVSNTDVSFIQGMGPQLATSQPGNILLLDLTDKLMDRKLEVSRMARDYAKKNGGNLGPGWDEQIEAWAQANPLFSPEDVAKAQDAVKAGPAPQTFWGAIFGPGQKKEVTTPSGKKATIERIAD